MSYRQLTRDSLELDSILPSEENQGEESAISSSDRGLSPLGSPIRSPEPWHREARDAGHRRSLSLSMLGSSFQALSRGTAVVPEDIQPSPHKKLTFLHGLGLVVGLQIGSGIFASPGHFNSYVKSPGAVLIVWLVAGLLAWTGAGCFVELGAALPINGGTQAYLGYIFGPLPSFMYTWAAMGLLKTGSAAIIALAFAEYTCKGLQLSGPYTEKGLGLAAVLLTGALNAYSTRLGANVGAVFFWMKILLLTLIVLTAVGGAAKYAPQGAFAAGLFTDSASGFSPYRLAIYGASWAYDGWDNLNFVSAEMANPTRDLPRVIATAMPLVITAYLLVNSAYYLILDRGAIEASTVVCLEMMERVLNAPGRVGAAILVAASCAGALNATVFSAARVIQSAAQEGNLPSLFARSSTKRHTPVWAVFLQTAITAFYVVLGEFNSLVSVYGAISYLFYLWAVVGLVWLRSREPNLTRPYKAWPSTIGIFILVSGFLVTSSIVSEPGKFAVILAYVLASIPVYYIKTRLRGS